MALYRIEWKRSAAKELKKLPKDIVGRIVQAVEKLSINPLPVGTRKVVGSKNTYRIRIGNYRVIYQVESQELIIEVIRVKHRKDAYRQ